jgi:hypothetical protein
MKRDEELYRLEQIMKAIDELDHRFFMLRHKIGREAEDRVISFLKSRKSWFFARFTNL